MTKMKMTCTIRKMRKVVAEEEFTSADPKPEPRRGCDPVRLYRKLFLQACGELSVSALLDDQMILFSNFHVLKLFLQAGGELRVCALLGDQMILFSNFHVPRARLSLRLHLNLFWQG